MLIDTHCHLEEEYYESVKDIIDRMPGYMITAGCDSKTNKEVLKRVQESDKVYGVIGIHPEFVENYQEEDIHWIEEHILDPKIVGIGEVGLDYHYETSTKEEQKKLFERMIQIAQKVNKPVVVHSRDAIEDTYDIMKKYPDVKFILHCYGSSLEMAYQFLKLNVVFGIGGVVTFKNGRVLKEVVKEIPLSHLLLETDSPYLSPEPYRGQVNEPKNTDIVAQTIAEIKGITKEEVIVNTASNAIREFDLPISL